jgi:hypothetical protein
LSKTFLIVNSDITYNQSRQPNTVVDGIKIQQDLAEMLSVSIQPNGFGAGIIDEIGDIGTMNAGQFTSFDLDLRNLLTAATARFVALQQSSSNNRATNELIASIVNVQTQKDPSDPTKYRWRIDYQTVNGVYQKVQGAIQVPG